jgi:hypothetical protein
MGWYTWPKKNAPAEKPPCRVCRKPIKAGDRFYFIETNPLVVEHGVCLEERVEKELAAEEKR